MHTQAVRAPVVRADSDTAKKRRPAPDRPVVPGLSLLNIPLSAPDVLPAPAPARYVVSHPDQPHEQEADRIARDFVRQTSNPVRSRDVPGVPIPTGTISRAAASGAVPVAPRLAGEVDAARGGGATLAPDLLAPMQHAFGRPLDHIRVHTDNRAHELSTRLHARAFAAGPDLFFKRGEYNPKTVAGQELIAHEVVHVMQGDDSILHRQWDDSRKDLSRSLFYWEHDGADDAPSGYYQFGGAPSLLDADSHRRYRSASDGQIYVERGGILYPEAPAAADVHGAAASSVMALPVVATDHAAVVGSGSGSAAQAAIHAGLRAFLGSIWANRGTIVGLDGSKAKIEWIYNNIYEGGAHASAAHDDTSGDDAVLQGLIQLGTQYGIAATKELIGRETRARLAREYFYFDCAGRADAHGGTNETRARIIIHSAPATVLADFQSVYGLCLNHPAVTRIKVGGPALCRGKLDPLIIYLNDNTETILDELVTALQGAGVNPVAGTPALTNEVSPGIAVADNPPKINRNGISFGQKRCIVAYMALQDAIDKSEQEAAFIARAARYFADAGISPAEPHRDGPAVEGMSKILLKYVGKL